MRNLAPVAKRVTVHNRIVAKQIRRSFLDLNVHAPGVLTRAPKGYVFTCAHKLVKVVDNELI